MQRVGLEWTLYDTHANFLSISTPQTPPSQQVKFYAKVVGGISTLCYINDAGTEICLPTSGTIVGTHNILSATHPDTLTDTVVRGDVLVGNATPKWSRLPKGSANQVLAMNGAGTDVVWANAGGNVTDSPAGTAGQVSYFTAAHTITSDAHLLWDSTNQKLSVIGKTGTGDVFFIQGNANDILHVYEDTGNSAGVLKVGKAAQTNAYVTTDESLIIIIDANNDQTNRSFSIGHDGAPGAQVGLFSINENGDLNLAASAVTWDNTGKVLLVQANSFPTLQLSDYESNTNPPIMVLFKARGTIASPSGVASGDLLGDIRIQGRDSAGNTANGAIIRATTSETWGGTARGTFISFITTITGGTSSAERWRIEASSGQLQNIQSANEATGGGSALLGSNSPAVTNTAPFTWIKFKTSDGSQVYIPCWK